MGAMVECFCSKRCETISAEACETLPRCDDSASNLWDAAGSLLPVLDELLLEFCSPFGPGNPKVIFCEAFFLFLDLWGRTTPHFSCGVVGFIPCMLGGICPESWIVGSNLVPNGFCGGGVEKFDSPMRGGTSPEV